MYNIYIYIHINVYIYIYIYIYISVAILAQATFCLASLCSLFISSQLLLFLGFMAAKEMVTQSPSLQQSLTSPQVFGSQSFDPGLRESDGLGLQSSPLCGSPGYVENVAGSNSVHFLQQHDEVLFFVQNPHLLGDLDAELCYNEYYGFINFLLELCNCPCKFLMVNLADLRWWLGPDVRSL